MILVDTAIWIDHLRSRDAVLSDLLEATSVLSHPFIMGELALGWQSDEQRIQRTFRRLDSANVAEDDEVLQFIGDNRLQGSGIGYVDAHLLVATRLTPETSFWTRDKRLRAVADRLSLSARLAH